MFISASQINNTDLFRDWGFFIVSRFTCWAGKSHISQLTIQDVLMVSEIWDNHFMSSWFHLLNFFSMNSDANVGVVLVTHWTWPHLWRSEAGSLSEGTALGPADRSHFVSSSIIMAKEQLTVKAHENPALAHLQWSDISPCHTDVQLHSCTPGKYYTVAFIIHFSEWWHNVLRYDRQCCFWIFNQSMSLLLLMYHYHQVSFVVVPVFHVSWRKVSVPSHNNMLLELHNGMLGLSFCGALSIRFHPSVLYPFLAIPSTQEIQY